MTRVQALAALRNEWSDCKRCGLCERRTQIAFDRGASHSKLLFLGEQPGVNEDETGKCFVGMSGQLLDATIEFVKIDPRDCYFMNPVLCLGMRKPQTKDLKACWPRVARQIELVDPLLIVTAGQISTNLILKRKGGAALRPIVGELHMARFEGQVIDFLRPVIPIWHPSFVLKQGGGTAEEGDPTDLAATPTEDEFIKAMRTVKAVWRRLRQEYYGRRA